jgi:hypothetical protein
MYPIKGFQIRYQQYGINVSNSMEQSRFWEANSFSASQEISRIL